MTSSTFDLSDAVAPSPDVARHNTPFTHVHVYTDAASVYDAWADLETTAPCSIYQTRGFILPWTETLGRKAEIAPRFVLARDRDGRPAALLCVGILQRGPIRVATWLGGKDANFNLPLLRRSSAWTRSDILRLLREAARACGSSAPDVFELTNQPLAWAGIQNAFAQLRNSESPSAAYGTSLTADPNVLFANKLSKDTRKKLRKKEARLTEIGAVTHMVASRADEQAAIIEAFLAQKMARFRERRHPLGFRGAGDARLYRTGKRARRRCHRVARA